MKILPRTLIAPRGITGFKRAGSLTEWYLKKDKGAEKDKKVANANVYTHTKKGLCYYSFGP